MEFRVKLEDEDIGPRIKQNMDVLGQGVRAAMQESARNAQQEVEAQVADDIEAAGNFGEEWIEALKTDINETQRTLTLDVAYEPGGPPVTYWHVFQYGATIHAKNARGLLTWPNKSAFAIGNTVPAFISKASVTIPKKFHIIEIIEKVAQEIAAEFGELLEWHVGR